MKSPPHPGYAYSKTLISVIFELSGRNANEDEAEIQIHISPWRFFFSETLIFLIALIYYSWNWTA
jgi:hypothetical protein